MHVKDKNYYAFLLRLMVFDGNHKRVWRASLEDPQTRQLLHFKSIEELFEFLLNLIWNNAPEQGPDSYDFSNRREKNTSEGE